MNVFPLIISLATLTPPAESVVEPVADSHLWSQCYDYLGCVNNTEEWYHHSLRPIIDQPLPRHIIKTTFILFNVNEDPEHPFVVEPLSPVSQLIRATKFDGGKSITHLLIHDFTSNGMAGWIKHAVKSLLAIDAGNLISVDWTGGAEPPYNIAVQNARLVALEVVLLLRILVQDFGIDAEKFYLIGQGLGAHIAGYVGQEINGVGRITGLDPVGLYFKDMPCQVRLDPRDAKFVDVIHTDIDTNHGQGSGDPYGHLNFFVNGGATQAGCNVSSSFPELSKISRDMLKEGEVAPGCNHKRAAKYFTASIDERDECTLMGYACGDYATFQRGDCTTAACDEGITFAASMGYFADVVLCPNSTTLPKTKFFLDTNYERPYCLLPYTILIALASRGTDPEGSTVAGMFRVSVFSGPETVAFRADLNVGSWQKLIKLDGINVFLTYQKPPEISCPEKMVLRFEAVNNDTIAHVSYVEIVGLPEPGKSATKMCGATEITVIESHSEAIFTRCVDKAELALPSGGDGKNADVPRPRRNPNERNPKFESETLDLADCEYDESEPPEPAEDDYYSNR